MSDVQLRLVADVDGAVQGIGYLSKVYQSLVNELAKPLKSIGVFRELESGLEDAERQTSRARDRVRELGNELARTAEPSKQLTAEYRDAVSELRRLERAESTAQQRLAARRRELNAAGVDTRNLVAEQQRLSRELNGALTAGRGEQAAAGIKARSAALAQMTRQQRAANLEAARQDLGVNRYRQLQAELGRVRGQYQLLRSTGNLTGRELAIAQRAMTERVRETQRALRDMNAEQRRPSSMTGLASGIGGAIGVIGGGYAAVSAISTVTRAADSYSLMNARLRLATESQEEFNTAQAGLTRIARETESPVQALVTLYGRISQPLREAGRSQEDILKVTEAVATSFRVSGATAVEAEQGVIQFAQALGSGALRGDEFNSVNEQAPRLMKALADGIGVPVTALKEMAAQGKLTAEVVTDALTGQLDTLRQEAESLPETVGGALTKLGDTWRSALGKADVQPLIDSINSLGETLSDPVVIDNLVRLASALTSLAGGAIGASSDFVDLGKQIAFTVAKSQGLVTEIDAIDNEIAAIDKSLDGSWSPGDLFTDLFFSTEELQAKRDALVALRASVIEQQTGMNAEMQFLADVAAEAASAARVRDVADFRRYISELDALRNSQVKAAEAAAKKLAAAEKKALSDIEKVRADRLKIEQRYQEALAGLNGGGEASYGAAQALKVGARQALAANDVEGAQRQAQAALKMLQDLAAAGQNTYGFAGFIQELQAIELAANDIEQTNAEDKLKAVREEIKSLEEQAKKLKGMPVSVKTDEGSIEAVRTQIQALIQQLGQTEITLPVRVVMPKAGEADADGYVFVPPNPPAPKFARGGILRGAGTGTSDSILMYGSNGEGILTARAVRHYGADLVHRINRLQLPGYATGGVIGGGFSPPPIPPLAPALQAQINAEPLPNLGRMVLELGGGDYTVYATDEQANELKLAARKFGRPGRR